MNVTIIGITGFVGSGLRKYFMDNGIMVSGIFREDFKKKYVLREKLEKSDVVINLSGASITWYLDKEEKEKNL